MRHLIRQIIREHACACEEQGMELPVPGVAYPIEIDEIIIEPIMDTIFPETPSIELDMMAFGSEADGRMLDYGHTKSDSKEGRMTRSKLFRMGQMSQSMHDRLDDMDDLPEWVQDKVTTAEDRLRTAYDYIDYKLHRMKQQGTMCNENTVRKLVRNYLRG